MKCRVEGNLAPGGLCRYYNFNKHTCSNTFQGHCRFQQASKLQRVREPDYSVIIDVDKLDAWLKQYKSENITRGFKLRHNTRRLCVKTNRILREWKNRL